MTRIDFYVLQAPDAEARLLFACRLIAKVLRQGHRIFVAARDREQADSLNTLLWTFQPESFTPHQIQAQTDLDCPILIGHGDDCGDHHDMLVNLKDEVPPYFSRFQRLAEVVIQAEPVLTSTRENWKFYRDRGYPIQSHSLS